ncbi:MAG: hypothetical protein GVY36_01900 [Verrucomicrobia bacterium]|jgi:hypothetical protein|nr:hypothetical protein [Verrucomicrobiota bacterium]
MKIRRICATLSPVPNNDFVGIHPSISIKVQQIHKVDYKTQGIAIGVFVVVAPDVRWSSHITENQIALKVVRCAIILGAKKIKSIFVEFIKPTVPDLRIGRMGENIERESLPNCLPIRELRISFYDGIDDFSKERLHVDHGLFDLTHSPTVVGWTGTAILEADIDGGTVVISVIRCGCQLPRVQNLEGRCTTIKMEGHSAH